MVGCGAGLTVVCSVCCGVSFERLCPSRLDGWVRLSVVFVSDVIAY